MLVTFITTAMLVFNYGVHRALRFITAIFIIIRKQGWKICRLKLSMK